MTRNDDKYIVAIELSGTSVRGVAARISASNHMPEIIAAEAAEKTACVQYGRVQNLIEAANHTSYVIKKLENNPALKHGKIVSMYVALAGRTLSTVRTTAEISLPTEMEMTDDLLRRLYQEATRDISPDRSVLKVVARKYIVDNHPVANPVGAMGSKLKGEFTIVVCSPVNLRNLELVMDERLNLPVADYIITPLAEAKLALTEEEKQLGCVLVDFGAHTTTISIYKDRSLQYIATLPLGSKNITVDIAAGLSLTDERAEQSKCSLGSALSKSASSPEASRVNCYVQARLGEIMANVMAQIGFAGFKVADLPGGIVIFGGGAKLKNFTKFVEQQSKMKVRQASAGTSVTMAPGLNAGVEFLPLISIVDMAASQSNFISCIEMPQKSTEHRSDFHTDTLTTSEPENYVDNEEEYDVEDSEDDDFWDKDDDEAERRKAAMEARIKERRKQLVSSDQERRRRREEHLRHEARKINHDADLDTIADETPERKQSLLDRIKQGVTNIFKSSENTDDADLDDEQ